MRSAVTGQDVEIDQVSMQFGGFQALQDICVHIPAGKFFSFLGPSGCGKTTLLRLIAGFLDPASGRIRINGKDMKGIGPNRRPTAMIFQNLALFPLMSVADNIGFGLEVRKIPKSERMTKIDALLELVDLPKAGCHRVSDLSGGQRQRVAIARALAVEPAVLLLDEPLSALDLKLRKHMRTELRNIQRRTGVTFVYITHDQGEALAMSDAVGVMSQGKLEQIATPDEIYHAPETAFVASFVGENNMLPGRIVQTDCRFAIIDTSEGHIKGRNPKNYPAGARVNAYIRPEAIRIETTDLSENVLDCTVRSWTFEGAFSNFWLTTAEGSKFLMRMGNRMPEPHVGSHNRVRISFSAEQVLFLAGEMT